MSVSSPHWNLLCKLMFFFTLYHCKQKDMVQIFKCFTEGFNLVKYEMTIITFY